MKLMFHITFLFFFNEKNKIVTLENIYSSLEDFW